MSCTGSEAGFLWRWYEEGLRLIFKAYFTGVHRIRIEGIERVPKGKEKLIVIANHASYLDGIIIWTYLRLPFRIVVDRTVASRLWLRPFLKNRYVVPLDFMNPYALKDVVRMVEEGLPLLVFPEGRRTSTGHIMKIYDGTGFAAFRTGARILPVYLRNTYNTIFARKHKGRHLFAPIAMTVGELQPPLTLESLPSSKRRTAARRIYAMLTDLYLEAHNKPSTLGREFFRICKENRGRIAFDDSTGHRVSYRKALLGALVLGRYVSGLGENIAVMLPNLTVTAIIFMGMQIYRKAPILLNYSSGPAALDLAMERAEADVVVTSRQLLQRMRLPETVFGLRKCIFLEDLENEIAFGDKVRAFFRVLFPGPLSEIRAREEKETAAILFTSGSEGVPKGVSREHHHQCVPGTLPGGRQPRRPLLERPSPFPQLRPHRGYHHTPVREGEDVLSREPAPL
jgi:acyl-[acyl-carrier-protein]-phospholipid O-acyltransferase/long-chain-fatty-acid--[acyl-carrier-protein] ligase